MHLMSETLDTDLAAELLGTAMRDSEAPVMQMAGALARINHALVRAQAAEAACKCPGLKQDIAICIQSLQFHDRLMQQLSAVRRLMGTAPMSGELATGFMPAEGSVELF
jgi:hypothetical protein